MPVNMDRTVPCRIARWRIWSVQALIVGLVLTQSVLQSLAGDTDSPPKTPESEKPSLELLDFIGSWVDSDGQWIDPADVEQLNPAGKEQSDDETD